MLIFINMVYLYFALSYLIGSINFSIIISRVIGLQDPRTIGSCNPGTTNMLRNAPKKISLLVFILDFMKGYILTFIPMSANISQILPYFGMLIIIGHIFPCFHRFKGGKGVATMFGVYAFLNPIIFLILLVLWLGTIITFRYSSASSILCCLLAPILFFVQEPNLVNPVIIISIIIILSHKSNIIKLYNGEENKIFKK